MKAIMVTSPSGAVVTLDEARRLHDELVVINEDRHIYTSLVEAWQRAIEAAEVEHFAAELIDNAEAYDTRARSYESFRDIEQMLWVQVERAGLDRARVLEARRVLRGRAA